MRLAGGTKILSLLALAFAVGAVYRVFFAGAEGTAAFPASASPRISGEGKLFLWELLPGFRGRPSASSRYHMPLEGRVVQAFRENGSGVVFETGYLSPVFPIGVGWVRKVTETLERGFFVEVKHGDGTVSRYGFLGEVYVHEGDFAYPDRPLGVVKARTLYLEIRRFDVAVDPLDVLAPAERPGRGE